jgi:hypothetical protein
MKIIKIVKSTLCMAILLNIGAASAYSPEESEKMCKKPRFTDFNLPEYKAPSNIETPAEAEFIIKVSAWVDPTTIKLTAKKAPLAFTTESTSTFHKIKAKLPASLNGEFVRLDVSAKAILGCEDKTGWLIKVANQ